MLVDNKATIEVPVENDTYTLRRFLGFYEAARMEQSTFTFRFPKGWSGESTDAVEAIPNHAERKLARLRAYLAGWSHAEPINDDNLKRLPPAHADKLLEEIAALEKAAQPFRGEPTPGTD